MKNLISIGGSNPKEFGKELLKAGCSLAKRDGTPILYEHDLDMATLSDVLVREDGIVTAMVDQLQNKAASSSFDKKAADIKGMPQCPNCGNTRVATKLSSGADVTFCPQCRHTDFSEDLKATRQKESADVPTTSKLFMECGDGVCKATPIEVKKD